MTESVLEATKTFSVDDIIPPALWSKDHWSTLAYVDTVMVDCAGFELGLDARMRSNRRNFREMSSVPTPKRAGRSVRSLAVVMELGDGTRLKDGQVVKSHDDWCCLQDMASVGFFTVGPDNGFAAGRTLHFSPLGQSVVEALRHHKQAGGQFATFDLSQVKEATPEALVPPQEEWFDWMGMTFDVAAILRDIAAGKLRVKASPLDREFIDQFGKGVLALNKANPAAKVVSIWMHVDSPRAQSMPDSVLEQPVIVAYVGKNKGILNLDGTGAHYVLIDGNHRMAKAFFAETQSMQVYVLSQTQIRPYKS
jgi:hypothetical protein